MSVDRTGDGGELPTATIVPYTVSTAPTSWLLCDGSAVSRTTYANLYNTISPSKGTFTVTIATPAVVTLNSHGLVDGDAVFLTTSSALPTGLSANTIYYVKSPAANTFNLSSTRDGTTGAAGTAINTSGTQSGTHTLYFCPYGKGDGSTTFNVPDLRAKVSQGLDSMGGGTDGGVLASVANAAGFASGEQYHTLTTTESGTASHNHTQNAHSHGLSSSPWYTGVSFWVWSAGGWAISGVTSTDSQTATNQNAATTSGSAHNIMQPYILLSYIIKT